VTDPTGPDADGDPIATDGDPIATDGDPIDRAAAFTAATTGADVELAYAGPTTVPSRTGRALDMDRRRFGGRAGGGRTSPTTRAH
jgi:hypothetical protein